MILANGNPACKVSVAADLCTLDGYVQEGYGCNNSQYASYFSAGALTCDFNFKNSGKIVVSFDAAKSDSKSATPICNLDFTVSKP